MPSLALEGACMVLEGACMARMALEGVRMVRMALECTRIILEAARMVLEGARMVLKVPLWPSIPENTTKYPQIQQNTKTPKHQNTKGREVKLRV